jgi:hypothetical protein
MIYQVWFMCHVLVCDLKPPVKLLNAPTLLNMSVLTGLAGNKHAST